jgi:hypothetical protein
MLGSKLKKPTNVRVVALPVIFHVQISIANRLKTNYRIYY